ncbi:MAG: hypothetical protein IT287_00560, partial [Bdellovibrionaceae bacterium]|nr:hypothetical protein [Pseudobdellovibrionaceae bacterium]
RETVAKPPSKEVEAFSKALKASGLAGKIEGLKMLSEARPNINKILEKISAEIVKANAQKNIAANKAQFDTLTENINAAAAQAAEMRTNRMKLEPSAEKLMEAIESLPGILLEVANAGPKADMQKALDVSRMLAELREKDLSNEVDASAKRKSIEDRLGTDKNGKQITLEELIKRCLGA